MLKWMSTVTLTVVGCVLAPGSRAAFNAELQPPPPSLSTGLPEAVVTQVGEGVAAATPGFGNALPLMQAMRMLLPDEWSYSPRAEVGLLTVSWSGANSWLEALRQIGESYGVRFLVDWPARVVYSEPSAVHSQTASRGSGELQGSRASSGATSWALEIGSLREQLAKWTDRAHYHLYWPRSIADISVQVPATLNGEFLEAVKQLGSALQAVGTGLKLHVYEQNQALVVEEY